MRRTGQSGQTGAKAPAKANKVKTWRVSFSDARSYYFDVRAASADQAQEQAEQKLWNGHEGTDHKHGGHYGELVGIEEVTP